MVKHTQTIRRQIEETNDSVLTLRSNLIFHQHKISNKMSGYSTYF